MVNSTDARGFQGAAQMTDVRLVRAIDGLDQRVVIAVVTVPTYGSIPAAAKRSVWRMETY